MTRQDEMSTGNYYAKQRNAEGKTMLKFNLCVLILLSFYILKAQYKNKYDKGIKHLA